MKDNTYTHTDYYTAAFQRLQDFEQLRKEQNSTIFTVYCAGVAIECMLRAYITKHNKPFDAKHDLEKLLIDSELTSLINDHQEKESILIAIKNSKRVWNNSLRYYSDKRLKRQIGHEMMNTKYKNINKYFNDKCEDLFKAAYLITKTGEQKWT